MSSNPSHAYEAMLTNTLDQLKKLMAEDDEIIKKQFAIPLDAHNVKDIKNTVEITNIMLKLATNHPELLKDKVEKLQNISIKRLDFRKSWEIHEELVVNDALTTLLNSKVCKDLQAFCGYPSVQILNNLPEKISKMRVSLGKHSDIVSVIEELRCRRQRHLSIYELTGEDNKPGEEIMIHLQCGELDLKNLTPLPDTTTKAYISNVTDEDVGWVVQAAISLLPKISMEGLYLPRSKLTKVGVESIVKGLVDENLHFKYFGVSSPYIVDDESEDSSNDDSEDLAEDDSEDSLDFDDMIEEKYDFEGVFINDELSIGFTEFTDYIPADVTDEFIKKLYEMGTNNDINEEEMSEGGQSSDEDELQ